MKRKISKEEYDRMSKLSYGELSSEVRSGLSEATIYGYGYYGCRLSSKDDEYYLNINIGSSCD